MKRIQSKEKQLIGLILFKKILLIKLQKDKKDSKKTSGTKKI